MSNVNISKDIINNIANQENKKFVKNINKLIMQLVNDSMQDLSNSISFISAKNVVLQPINELVSGAFIDASNFVYLLGIENIQLELNTAKKMSFLRNLKERFKYAWQNRKLIYKRRKKHRKKSKKELEKIEEKKEVDFNNYTIYSLAEDLQNSIVNYLSETSMVYLNGNLLQIIGKDDFGSNTKIFIYVVSYDGTNYKYYAGKKKGYININVNGRVDKLSSKMQTAGENFIKILKILNTLYYNTNGYMCNQIFMESILCSVPEDLFFGLDIYNVFVKIINYLSITSFKNIKSINNYDLTIFNDVVCGNCMLGFNKMMNKIITKN